MKDRDYGFDTVAIHGNEDKDQFGSLIPPVYNTSTFIFDSTDQGAARFSLEEPGYIYTRIGNPSCLAVEQKIAKLEGGEAAIATASGMGAICATIWTLINAGEEIVADSVKLATLAVSLGATETLIEHPAYDARPFAGGGAGAGC